ncbi:energy-coupling factor transporter transmembrane component T family protein [Aureimonas populi]|nr:energy-coupling factor transporter transmembrane protein EcfT [Aureimonas populi]
MHRLRPGAKLLALPVLATLLFLTADLFVLGAAFLGALALFPLARLSMRLAATQLRPALLLLLAIFAAQVWMADIAAALAVVLRLVALLLLASLVTLTTRTAAMVDTIEWSMAPLRPLGVDPAKVGLALSMTIRFVPLLAGVLEEVREAQKARGAERSTFALAVPVILRALKMTDEIADAIDARS